MNTTATRVQPPRESADVAAPPPPEPAPPLTFIRPPAGWQLINVRELWRFRELIYFLAWRDVKVRYKQTVLGAAWAVLQPALLMVVFTLFLGRMANLGSDDSMPYPLFVYVGLLPWTFFATAVANAGNSVVGQERLVTKIYFPRLAIPFASVAAGVVDFCCALGLLAVLMAFYRTAPGPGLLLAPLIYLAVVLAAAGMGTFLAALNVKYRDFRYVIPFLMQVWMFATPAVFLPTGSSDGWRVLLLLNPMNGLVAAFRAAVLGQPIAWMPLATGAALAVLLFVGGCLYFRKVEDDFADVI
jgi:lipopolysaccharide transport system permease protein